GDVVYDELPKEMLVMVVPDADKDFVLDAIMMNAKSDGEGKFGDGKIFVSKVEEVYTISTGKMENEPEIAESKEA
nr:P-II family nitrogen regulator [Chlorobium phaeobacteroides]